MHAVSQLGDVLGVWAHPDDETYLSGGIMAAAASQGRRVACVTATAGERGITDPAGWPPQQVARIRRTELREALRILGVRQHHWLGYEDGRCADVPPDEAVARLVALIERHRPDTVLTFGPDGVTGHPDHIAVGRWAAQAAAGSARPVRVLAAAKDAGWVRRFRALHDRYDVFRAGYPRPVPAGEPALRVDLPDDLLERKVAALRAQDSQTGPIIAAFGLARWREWIRTETFVAVSGPGVQGRNPASS